ncbi:hypothetical protein RJ639_024138 [Escallonia herrerae]|uniref:Cathepsin propeptide inhibitor domain-containing protein n=1 Tax=Escallonia herrerae TaxID=1293975 RepID=A0AA88V1K0_9ASTE|nr:hypothetical protein RJ639_024138 [Escallonia herrerae]
MVDEDPDTYTEAMSSSDAPFWREAIDEEMHSIMSNNTWLLVDTLEQWHEKFRSIKLANGCVSNRGDIYIFSKFRAGSDVLIGLYVDDMLIFGTDIDRINEAKNFLASNFSMKDLGEADEIDGFEDDGILMCQAAGDDELFAKHHFTIFKLWFGKTYAPKEEHDSRFTVFKAILNRARCHHKLNPSAVHDVSQFLDLSPKEIRRNNLELKRHSLSSNVHKDSIHRTDD